MLLIDLTIHLIINLTIHLTLFSQGSAPLHQVEAQVEPSPIDPTAAQVWELHQQREAAARAAAQVS